MINGIMVVGKFGAGKSTFIDELKKQLLERSVRTLVISDRILIEAKILKDVGQSPVEPKVFVIELEASFDVRAKRNLLRDDGVPDEAFRRFAYDGGELLPLARGKLDGHYVNISNNRDNKEIMKHFANLTCEFFLVDAFDQEARIISEGWDRSGYRIL